MVQRFQQKLTPAMIRAARGYLNWERSDLARECGLSLASIQRIENGAPMRAGSEASIIRAFQEAGIFMIYADSRGGAGIRQIKIA